MRSNTHTHTHTHTHTRTHRIWQTIIFLWVRVYICVNNCICVPLREREQEREREREEGGEIEIERGGGERERRCACTCACAFAWIFEDTHCLFVTCLHASACSLAQVQENVSKVTKSTTVSKLSEEMRLWTESMGEDVAIREAGFGRCSKCISLLFFPWVRTLI